MSGDLFVSNKNVFIYLKKGEIWAIFRDWNKTWNTDPEKHKGPYKYDVVEIVSDFTDMDGLEVAYLGKVTGFVSLFHRHAQHGILQFQVPPEEMFRFSHKVPSSKLTGNERESVPADSRELDPAALPQDLFQVDAVHMEQDPKGRTNDPYPEAPKVEENSKPVSETSPPLTKHQKSVDDNKTKVPGEIGNNHGKALTRSVLPDEVKGGTRRHELSSCQASVPNTPEKFRKSSQAANAFRLHVTPLELDQPAKLTTCPVSCGCFKFKSGNPNVVDMLRVAELQRQDICKLVEKIKAYSSETMLSSRQLKCLYFDMIEANVKSPPEVEVKEKALQKRTKIFEAAKEEAGDLKKLVEECTEELKSKKDQLSARLDTLKRTEGELDKAQTSKIEMEEEINRKMKELALILHKIEESGKQLKTVDEQLEDRWKLMERRSMELVSKEKELECVEESIKPLILDFELKEKELDLKSKELGEIQKLIEEKTNELGVMHKQHDSVKLLIQERTEELVAKEKRCKEILEAICKSSAEVEDKENELDLLKNQIISEEKKLIQLRKLIDCCSTDLVKPEQDPPAVPINDTSQQNEAEFELVNEDTLIQDDVSTSLAHHEVSSVLRAIPNPAEFVLDLVEEEICASYQRELRLQDSVVENLVLLLEELTKLQRLKEPQLQPKATQVATLWKEKIRIEAPRSSLEALAFLLFILAYGLKNLMNQDETASLASSIVHYKQATTLFRSLDLNHKIPEHVVDLIAKRQYIPAASLICLFKLKGISPLDLLKEEIINLRRSTTEKTQSQSQADDKDGERLRGIIELVADYKLEIDLPGDLIVKLILHRENST